MKKKLHPVLLVSLCVLFLYAVLGNFKFTWIGWSGNEAKAGSPGAQKSDREVTLADYGFYEWAGGCSLVIISPTVVKISDVPGVGPRRFFPSASDFAFALEHLGRYRQIKHVVPITGTIGQWRRSNGWDETGPDDNQSRTAEIIVIVDDPRNPEKR